MRNSHFILPVIFYVFTMLRKIVLNQSSISNCISKKMELCFGISECNLYILHLSCHYIVTYLHQLYIYIAIYIFTSMASWDSKEPIRCTLHNFALYSNLFAYFCLLLYTVFFILYRWELCINLDEAIPRFIPI